MDVKLPKNLQDIAATTLTDRRGFLKKTGTVAGLASAGAFTQLLPGSTAEAQYTPSVKPSIALPPKYDLRSVGAAGANYITEVRNQNECNSCTAYAVVAAIEGAISIKNHVNNPTMHLSENQLFFCGGSNGCQTNAWYPDGALTYCRDTGITDAALFGTGQQCQPINPSWPITKISSFQQLPDASAGPTAGQTAIKQCLTGIGPYTQSPVVAVLVLYDSLFEFNANSVNNVYRFKDHSPFEVREGGHVVCIVGYDDHPGYWICKNSWGPDRGGLGGYYNIAYGDCHIDNFMMYGVVP